MDLVILLGAVFLACAVEAVEALTVILAIGMTRDWRSAWQGVAGGLAVLAVVVTVLGQALTRVPIASLRLVVGALLLVFGLQWLRKAILRASGLASLHDEEAAFRAGQETARQAGHGKRLGLDWFAFTISFKGVFLEGLEVVFIVITFGLSASRHNAHGLVVASASAALAGLLVVVVGVIARRPLSAVPENTMKYAVGLLLTSFGIFWAVEGLGYFGSGVSLTWPGQDWAILGLVVGGLGLSRLAVAGLRRTSNALRIAGS